MRVLGIETSCDETAAAIVGRGPDGAPRILSDIVLSQVEDHSAFGGVVPEIAARAHLSALDRVIEAAVREAGMELRDIDAVAATGGVIGIGYWDEVTCNDMAPSGIAKMIKAAIAVVGEDHVSLGSDFDGSVETAFDSSEMAALTQALMDQGLSEAQIRKVMGENMLRVLRDRLPD